MQNHRKRDEIVVIILITILGLLFCAKTLQVFICLLVLGLVIGIAFLPKGEKAMKK